MSKPTYVDLDELSYADFRNITELWASTAGPGGSALVKRIRTVNPMGEPASEPVRLCVRVSDPNDVDVWNQVKRQVPELGEDLGWRD